MPELAPYVESVRILQQVVAAPILVLLLAHSCQLELEKMIRCRPDALCQALETVIQAARKSIPQNILGH
jgi:hypothetical protein